MGRCGQRDLCATASIKDSSFIIIGTAKKSVEAIDVYSSCDDENYRLKNFRRDSGQWRYNVSNKIGNLCNGTNQYIIRAFSASGAGLSSFLLDAETINLTSEYNDVVNKPS
jgi:hypothetical protein